MGNINLNFLNTHIKNLTKNLIYSEKYNFIFSKLAIKAKQKIMIAH